MEATAAAAQPTPPRQPGVPWLPLFALLIFVVYPLSIGPAFKLAEMRVLPAKALGIYLPLTRAAEQIPPIRTFINWYVFQAWKVFE